MKPFFSSALTVVTLIGLAVSAQAGQKAQVNQPAQQTEHLHELEFDGPTSSVFSNLFVRITNGNSRQAIRYAADSVTAEGVCKSFLKTPTAHAKKWMTEDAIVSTPVVKLDQQGQAVLDQSTKYLDLLECEDQVKAK